LAESGQGQCFTIEKVNAIYDIRTFWLNLSPGPEPTWEADISVTRPDEVFARLRQVPPIMSTGDPVLALPLRG
jgi:hypothetical protein